MKNKTAADKILEDSKLISEETRAEFEAAKKLLTELGMKFESRYSLSHPLERTQASEEKLNKQLAWKIQKVS
jgi:hypothetical protein